MIDNIFTMIALWSGADGLAEILTEAGSRMMDHLRDHILLVLLATAVLVEVVITLLRSRSNLRKQEVFHRKLKERSETIEKQRQQESELRKELEKKQKELEAALQTAQTAYHEKAAVLTDLEEASELARLASFHYDFNSRKRTGSNLVRELWPEDENGNALLEEQWVCPEDIPIFKQNIKALLEKKSETAQFSFRVGGAADDLRHYRMKLSLDPHNPKAVNGIVQDVTELTQSMLKLKDTQALWDAAINSIPIMFTVKDIDDGFRYLLCNKEFARTFNFSPDEIVGKTDPISSTMKRPSALPTGSISPRPGPTASRRSKASCRTAAAASVISRPSCGCSRMPADTVCSWRRAATSQTCTGSSRTGE